MTFTSTGTENLMAWDRRARPFMEVWYCTAGHRTLRSGLWLRYTISVPRHGDPSCALWGFYFDPERRRSFAGRTDHPIDFLGHVPGRDDGAVVRIGDAWLSETHLEGRVDAGGRTLAWSLDFEPPDRTYQHLPAWLNALAARRFSTLCSPNLAVPLSGTVELDGDPIRYEGEPGAQSHRWGRRHSHSWAWAHCSLWDGGDDAVFEGIAAQAARGLSPLPLLYLRYHGEDLVFHRLRAHGLRARSHFGYDDLVWAFASSNDGWRVTGAARLRPEHAVQVRYADPDGGERHCLNSEIADLALSLYERDGDAWREVGVLASNGGAHFELGRPAPFPEVPVAF